MWGEKKNMNIRKEKNGVTAVISTVLLLSMAIAFFSILSVVVLSIPSTPSSPSANLISMVDGEYLMIEHRGGHPLSLDTKIIIKTDTATEEIRAGDNNYLNEKTKDNQMWDLGEVFIYNNPDFDGKNVHVTVVDVESNSIIMTSSNGGR